MNDSDMRVIKTKKAIRDALFAILEKKPIGKITVSEIAEAACINRKTFYAHYDTIEDILAEAQDELIVNIDAFLKSCIIEEYGLSPYYYIQFLNMIYTSNPEFCESLVSTRNYHFMVEKLKKILKEQIRISLRIPEERQALANLRMEFYISGVASVYIEWIREGKPCSFDTLCSILAETVTGDIPPSFGQYL